MAPLPCSRVEALRPSDKRPLGGTCRVFYPCGGNKLFPKYLGRGLFSPSAPLRSLHCALHSRAFSLLPRSVHHGSKLCFGESCALLNLWVSAHKAVCKKEKGTLHISHSPVHGTERFSSCANPMLHFHNPLAFFPFCLSTERVPSPLCLYHYISPNSHTRTLILPGSFPPTVEILLPPYRSISWMFQVIWPQYSCVWGMRKILVPLLLCHLNSLYHMLLSNTIPILNIDGADDIEQL